MTTPQDRGWGFPGRRHGDADARRYGRDHIVTITVSDGSRFSVRREVAHLFEGFLNEILGRGYKIKGPTLDDWGWYVRPIKGTRVPSNHSWGLAVDVNALTNPQGPHLVTDMPDWVPQTAAKWGLHWGGNYSRNPDAMHFEFLGRPEDVARWPVHTQQEEDDDVALSDEDIERLAEVLAPRVVEAMYREAEKQEHEAGFGHLNKIVGEVRRNVRRIGKHLEVDGIEGDVDTEPVAAGGG